MKNILISATIALASLLPLNLPAQANIPKGNCLRDNEIFLGAINKRTLCLSDSDGSDLFVLYENLSTFKNVKFIMFIRKPDTKLTGIKLVNYATDTGFFIFGKEFMKWSGVANPELVTEHARELAMVMNVTDAYYEARDARYEDCLRSGNCKN
jgi:hypothetical protein